MASAAPDVNDDHPRLNALPPSLVFVGSCTPPPLEFVLKPRKLLRKLLSAVLDIGILAKNKRWSERPENFLIYLCRCLRTWSL